MSISVSLGLWKPWVQTAVQKFNSLWPSTSLGTYPGHDPDRSLATDLMIPGYTTAAGKAFGWAVAKEIWSMADELGIWYVIFDAKIISKTPGKGYWKTYYPTAKAIAASRDSAYHYNHVHVSWYATAPAGWKPVDGTVWIDLLVDGVSDSTSIALVQKALGVPQTRTWDAATKAAAEAFQRSLGDDVDGYLGKLQTTALFAKVGMNVVIRTDPSGVAPAKPVDPVVPEPPVIVKPKPEPEPEPEPTWTWDGKSYPGMDKLQIGQVGPWVTALGEMLVKHGYTGYSYGPGPEYGPKDDEGVVWFKRLQGWSGGPRTGKATWDLLAADPKPAKPVSPTKDDVKERPVPKQLDETILGWNILRRTDTVAGRKRWPERKPLIGKVLRAAKASVYLLVETDSVTARDCAAELGDSFAYWRYRYYTIIWDTRVWRRDGGAQNEFEYRDNENRYLLSLPLTHEATGEVVVFDVTHLENDGDPTTDGHKARYIEATHLAQKAHTGNRVGFFDCNSTTPADVKAPNARQKQKPRMILAAAGARFLSVLGQAVKNLAYGTHHGGKSRVKGPFIDDAWTFGDLRIHDAEVVRTDGTDASDHNALKFKIRKA